MPEKVIGSQRIGFKASVLRRASTVTGGNITELGAKELRFLDLVVGRWSFHSMFSIF